MSEGILLTITMLVSDRVDTIEKCMESLVHLREAVPSELIVVDTAGNQACMDIVRQYTDNIVEFEWCSDFAAARNAGVSKAKGEWLMFLDDDEWFENTDDLENFFLSGDCRKYNSACYIQRNYSDIKGTIWKDFDAGRMIKREKNTRFVGKVHEYLTPRLDPTYYSKDYVHHYGYIYKTEQERSRHLWRNIELLLEMRRTNPRDAHTMAQLIQEYAGAREYFSAIELCKELRKMPDRWASVSKARYTNYAVMMEMTLYIRQQRHDEACRTAEELLNQPKISLLAKGVLQNQMVTCCYELGKYDEALEYLEKYKESNAQWAAWDDISTKKAQDAFSQCSAYMDPDELNRLALLRLHILALQGKWQEAGEGILAIDWENGRLKILRETPGDIVSTLKEAPFDQGYAAALETLHKKPPFRAEVYKAVDKSSDGEKDLLMAYLRHLPLTDPEICRYRLAYAVSQGDAGLAVPALEKMREAGYPFFLKNKAYWDSLYKLGIDINSYMGAISGYDWMESARRLWLQVPIDICETAYLCLIRGLEKTDVRYTFISALMMEKRLFADTEPEAEEAASGTEDTENTALPAAAGDEAGLGTAASGTPGLPEIAGEGVAAAPAQDEALTPKKPQPVWMSLAPEEVWERLNLLSQYWVSCAAALYREEVFVGGLFRNLPSAYQFGWYIMQANAVKSENTNLFLVKVADAAKAYPAMKELCKKVITGYRGN